MAGLSPRWPALAAPEILRQCNLSASEHPVLDVVQAHPSRCHTPTQARDRWLGLLGARSGHYWQHGHSRTGRGDMQPSTDCDDLTSDCFCEVRLLLRLIVGIAAGTDGQGAAGIIYRSLYQALPLLVGVWRAESDIQVYWYGTGRHLSPEYQFPTKRLGRPAEWPPGEVHVGDRLRESLWLPPIRFVIHFGVHILQRHGG